jgi:hypothetical protein
VIDMFLGLGTLSLVGCFNNFTGSCRKHAGLVLEIQICYRADSCSLMRVLDHCFGFNPSHKPRN